MSIVSSEAVVVAPSFPYSNLDICYRMKDLVESIDGVLESSQNTLMHSQNLVAESRWPREGCSKAPTTRKRSTTPTHPSPLSSSVAGAAEDGRGAPPPLFSCRDAGEWSLTEKECVRGAAAAPPSPASVSVTADLTLQRSASPVRPPPPPPSDTVRSTPLPLTLTPSAAVQGLSLYTAYVRTAAQRHHSASRKLHQLRLQRAELEGRCAALHFQAVEPSRAAMPCQTAVRHTREATRAARGRWSAAANLASHSLLPRSGYHSTSGAARPSPPPLPGHEEPKEEEQRLFPGGAVCSAAPLLSPSPPADSFVSSSLSSTSTMTGTTMRTRSPSGTCRCQCHKRWGHVSAQQWSGSRTAAQDTAGEGSWSTTTDADFFRLRKPDEMDATDATALSSMEHNRSTITAIGTVQHQNTRTSPSAMMRRRRAVATQTTLTPVPQGVAERVSETEQQHRARSASPTKQLQPPVQQDEGNPAPTPEREPEPEPEPCVVAAERLDATRRSHSTPRSSQALSQQCGGLRRGVPAEVLLTRGRTVDVRVTLAESGAYVVFRPDPSSDAAGRALLSLSLTDSKNHGSPSPFQLPTPRLVGTQRPSSAPAPAQPMRVNARSSSISRRGMSAHHFFPGGVSPPQLRCPTTMKRLPFMKGRGSTTASASPQKAGPWRRVPRSVSATPSDFSLSRCSSPVMSRASPHTIAANHLKRPYYLLLLRHARLLSPWGGIAPSRGPSGVFEDGRAALLVGAAAACALRRCGCLGFALPVPVAPSHAYRWYLWVPESRQGPSSTDLNGVQQLTLYSPWACGRSEALGRPSPATDAEEETAWEKGSIFALRFFTRSDWVTFALGVLAAMGFAFVTRGRALWLLAMERVRQNLGAVHIVTENAWRSGRLVDLRALRSLPVNPVRITAVGLPGKPVVQGKVKPTQRCSVPTSRTPQGGDPRMGTLPQGSATVLPPRRFMIQRPSFANQSPSVEYAAKREWARGGE